LPIACWNNFSWRADTVKSRLCQVSFGQVLLIHFLTINLQGKEMAQITLKGNPINTNGELPAVGSKAPAFSLVKTDLSVLDSKELTGKRVILNIFPSIDTPVCQTSAKTFNTKASSLDNTVVLCVSKDLPFALNRYCGAEGLDQVLPASAFRTSFTKDFGVEQVDGPLEGLAGRAVVVLDENGEVKYSELVSEIAEEPDYDAALASLN